MDFTEKTLDSKDIFKGVIVHLKVDKVELPDGTTSVREVVEHPGGVCILPLSSDGTVTLVSQYRYPFQCEIVELPAGKLDDNEDHRLAAARELGEETGYISNNLVYLGCLLTSPGFSTEVLHMYLAMDLVQGAVHPDEGEFLNLQTTTFNELVDRVMDGSINDGKTVATVLKAKEYLSRNKIL